MTISTSIRALTLLGGLFSLLFVAGCGGRDGELPRVSIENDGVQTKPETGSIEVPDVDPVQLTASRQGATSPATLQSEVAPRVRIRTSLGDILICLDPEKAPRTVENFLYNYVERGFYSNSIVHFVESGYMIAAGGYGKNYEAKETRTAILCEADNGLKNLQGTIAMARHPDYPNSATSQFFINLADSPSLDYQATDDLEMNGYCVFGKVVEGFDVVEQLGAVRVHDKGEFVNTPVEPIVIESVERVK